MNKADLLNWLQNEYRRWELFLDEFGRERLDQPGVIGQWSMKDVVAHLTGWQLGLVARLGAAQRGEPEPPPPWPAHLENEDAINAWIYETNRERSVREVLDASQQVFQQLIVIIESLPEDLQVDTVRISGQEYYPIWVGGQRFPPGEFFDHFRNDHEPDLRAWLTQAKVGNSR